MFCSGACEMLVGWLLDLSFGEVTLVQFSLSKAVSFDVSCARCIPVLERILSQGM